MSKCCCPLHILTLKAYPHHVMVLGGRALGADEVMRVEASGMGFVPV